jgi:hypothetical protein
MAPRWEPYELRDSRTVLREPRGGTPRGYSPVHWRASRSNGGGHRKQTGEKCPQFATVDLAWIVGRMLWFIRKKFVGSYLFFRATRRS